MHDLHVNIDVYILYISQDGIARRVIVTLHTIYAVMHWLFTLTIKVTSS